MGGSTHMSFALGALMIGGGTFAFIKKKSTASLIAGCGTGLMFLGSGLLLQSGENKKGHLLALATSLALVGGMAPRAAKTGKFMPAGLVATIGVLSSVYQGKKVAEWWNES